MISTIIQYNTSDIIFLKANLEQSSKFSDEIILPICSHLYNGESEDSHLLNQTFSIVKEYPKARIIRFDWNGQKPHNCYYHNLSRKIGTDHATNDWLFFLDADEIVSDEFNEWFEKFKHLDHAWWFSCYWYFREPIYQAVCNEGAGLLIPKKYCDWNLDNILERAQLFQKLYNQDKLTVSGISETFSLSGKKLIHHYSWVRSYKNMLSKVRNWAHYKDGKDWESLVHKEFSGPFNNTDFVNSYKDYIIVDNFFDINVNFFEQLLHRYILDEDNPINNYRLGMYYESMNQTASAISYFLRCAERSESPELQYECLLRASSCFEKQEKRNFTVKGLLQHAISILPKRPEAYYVLSKFYEKEESDGSWQDSYMISSIGEKVTDPLPTSLINNPINYPGLYAMSFQKGVAAWWCGLIQESRDIFLSLLHEEPQIDTDFLEPCLNNLRLMKTKPFVNFDKQKHKLKWPFKGLDAIRENYSEAFQDIFVLTLLNGKIGGTYLEIGAGDPYYGNNTYLLENNFQWNGFAIDIDEEISRFYNEHRKNMCFCKDATSMNFEKFLNGLDIPKTIDYLQLDCDPPDVTYKILINLPLDNYRFAIITYEHDNYSDDTKSFQYKSSKYLENYGYVKVLNNIAPDNHRNYEDWWVHPDLIKETSYRSLINTDNSIKNSKNIFIEKR